MSLLPPSPETYDRVRGLRVVRAFTADPISTDDLMAILEAGRWTGSSKNVQGWHFVVVDGDHLEQLASAGSFTDPIRNSATTIAIVQTPEGNEFDVGRAAQNMMLAAATRGIGSCPITLHDAARAIAVLELAEGFSCRYAVAIGIPDEPVERTSRKDRRRRGVSGRKSLDDLVYRQVHGAG